KPARRDRIENVLGRYDLVAVMVPAVLPPPFPFKPFILCAGGFRLKAWRFIAAVFVGRLIRFLIEGWLAMRFGDDALGIIQRHGWKVLITAALLTAAGLLLSFFRSRRSKQASVAQGSAG